MNENDAYLFDIEEPKNWTFSGNPVWVKGWFLSKEDAIFSDFRALIDGLPHMGLWNLPRPEIEEQYRGHQRVPHAGFECLLRPPAGSKLLQFQLRDAGGNWVEIWRQKIKVTSGPRRKGRLRPGIVPDQLRKLLQHCRAHPDQERSPLAQRLALESSAHFETKAPSAPFYGALEKPIITAPAQYGKINIEGWIVHQDQMIERLLATTHPLVENELDFGQRARPEIGERFPENPQANHPQFFGMIDIDETAGDPAYLNIFAELADGSRHLVFAHRFHQHPCSQFERPLPPYDRSTFWQIAWEFAQACRQQNIQLGGLKTYWTACREARARYASEAPAVLPNTQSGRIDPYTGWCKVNELTPTLKQILIKSAESIGTDGPRFIILVDTRDSSRSHLKELAASLKDQIYSHWETWYVGPTPPPSDDGRFHSAPVSEPKGYLQALNNAVTQAQGSHVVYLPGHSRLSPDALLEVTLRIVADPTLELIYTDEDRMDDVGHRSAPSFKPDWSPALALSGIFPGNLSVISKARLGALNGFENSFDRVPWYDILLKISETLSNSQVAHIPLVCHHRRASLRIEIDLVDASIEQSRKALDASIKRRNWTGSALLPESAHHRRENFHQIRWDPQTLTQFPVTIVIPTRDRLNLLQECVELLDETVDWSHVKLIIVDDHSRDTDILNYFAAIQQREDLQCKVVKTDDHTAPFNYSRLVNTALPYIDTPLILQLNNDVNALESGWIEEMAGWFAQDDVGIVGAKLVYPEKTLNHTGIIIGPHGGLADTPYAKADESEVDTIWHAVTREVSSVTGACLMTRTSLYRELNGFDEKDFGVSYNDVDYCLRVRENGQRVLYTPQAKLMHWGSATRGVTFDEAEHIAFLRRYPGYQDPYFSPHWQLSGSKILCTGARHARTDRIDKLRVLIITHNLNLEGAPLFILEYAKWLVNEAGFSVNVISAQEGPLRTSFEELGSNVTLMNAGDIYGSADEEIFHSRVAELSHQLDWENIDLVVCNTLANFWGIHLARLGGCPSLFYIHESTSIQRFFENSLPSDLLPLVSSAFADCTRALFLCQATRDYYEDLNLNNNFQIVPSWIQLDQLDQYKASHSRDVLRQRFGFSDNEIIIANIGTVCERKGQHIFIRAAEHFNRQHPHGPKVRFLLVGAREGIYLDLLKRDIAHLGLENLTLVPETRDVLDYFIAADMFVCSSFEESFPRVIMEAMALHTPIVSTNVHGIPELVQQRADAYLVPPGDHLALSKMMWTCLAKERSGKSLTPTAYSKVMRYQNHRQVLPQHVCLAKEACLLQ